MEAGLFSFYRMEVNVAHPCVYRFVNRKTEGRSVTGRDPVRLE